MRTAWPAPTRWRRSPLSPPIGRVGFGVLIAFVMLFLFFFLAAGLGLILTGAALAVGLALLVWQRPMLGVTALIVLGTIHPFLMLLVFHLTRTPTVVKGAQLWKEVVVLILLAKVVDLAFRRRRVPRVHLLDLAIGAFLVYASLYLLYPVDNGSSIVPLVMGLRADAFFLVAYFVGRGLVVDTRQVRSLIVAFAVTAFVVAVIAAVQFVSPGVSIAIFNMLSFPDYMALQRGDEAVDSIIRHNFIGGAIIPRASSLLLSDLGLAFYTLLAAPLAVALYLGATRLREQLLTNVLTLAMLATTMFSMTRSAMIAMAPALGVLVFVRRGFFHLLVVALQVMIVVLLIGYRLDVTPRLLQQMFSPGESSVQGHIAAVELSIELLRESPFGRGLGTAGQIAQRFDVSGGVTNESWYLQIATEIGVIGGVLFATIVIGFGIVAFLRFGQVGDPWLKALCLGMGGSTIGLGLVSLTLHAWEALTVSIIFWLFAGLVVRALEIEAEDLEAGDARRGLA